MTDNRRAFIQKAGMLAGAFTFNSLFNQIYAADIVLANKKVSTFSPEKVAADEDYWATIQEAYTVNPNIINLNNGGVSPAPKVVQDAMERYNRLSNEGPS
ncbi:MAG: aminotransferase, partial [Bacteroidota bacterium]|nr:aminotransferase [Bacteroidota bacterium]